MNPDLSNDTAAPAAAEGLRLDSLASGVPGEVMAVDGDDALAAQLSASGLWAGARIERIASAPFGGPLLFRVHGYRLALRRDEAARVQVRPADSKPVASE